MRSNNVFQLNILLLLASLFLIGCNSENNPQTEASSSEQKIFTRLESNATNIQFSNKIKEDFSTQYNVLNFQYLYNGGGVGIADLDNDGLQDIVFTGNMVADEVYQNKGDLSFEKKASFSTSSVSSEWSNGVSFVDINQDGKLDIYICKGGPSKKKSDRTNKLYINKGNFEFSEQAEQYGLSDNNISTQAAFFDYDMDGDLDCFVMNNAVSNPADIHGNEDRMKSPKLLNENSCHLYENKNNRYEKVTKQAGLLAWSYGLGLLIQDINNDNYPDIYVSNDYYIPDFMYINNGDGTFTEEINSRTSQISFFGMGTDAADINNDGHVDLAVLDMSSNDHIRSKTLMPSMDVDLFYYLKSHFGFQSQYMFNSLQLNNGDGTYSNIAQLAGLANTEWSWSVLLNDLNLDGHKDMYITNGIKSYLNDNDFKLRMEKLANQQKQGAILSNNDKLKLYQSMPKLKTKNLAYKNASNLSFQDVSKSWGLDDDYNSNGAAIADLDNDGDEDIVINNLDDSPIIYRNKSSQINNYLAIQLPYEELNCKLDISYQGNQQYYEFHPVRGYQSSQDRKVIFGLGKYNKVDSLIIEWKDGSFSLLTDLESNQTITPTKGNITMNPDTKSKTSFVKSISPTSSGLQFDHVENPFLDIRGEILLPYMQSYLGPKFSSADINNDGLIDFYIGGANKSSGALFIQTKEGKFKSMDGPWKSDASSEDLGSCFLDVDNDGLEDLYVCSGGNEFRANTPPLQDRLYLNKGGGKFVKSDRLPDIKTVTMVATPSDFDNDGDIDLFIGGRQQSQKYPLAEQSYLLINENGTFKQDKSTFASDPVGMVNDAQWCDIDSDGDDDLIIATEWGPILLYINNDGTLTNQTDKWGLAEIKGWWQSVSVADLDGDGDLDIVGGNLGLNSKYKATKEKPLKLHYGDFDSNGKGDLFLSKKYKDNYVPVRGFECSSEQMPGLKQKFDTYESFANADIFEVLDIDKPANSQVFETNQFASGIFENQGGTFEFSPFQNEAQLSPIIGSQVVDINKDGVLDIVVCGNLYNTEPETPRLDATSSNILINKGNLDFKRRKSDLLARGNLKDVLCIPSDSGDWILIGRNNESLIGFKSSYDQ